MPENETHRQCLDCLAWVPKSWEKDSHACDPLMQMLVKNHKKAKGEVRALTVPSKPSDEILTVDADVKEFLVESNAIEGVHSHEMLVQSILAWDYLMKQDRLSPQVVKKTHKILMLHSDLSPHEKGYYREIAIYVGGHEGLIYHKIPDAMGEWIERMNTNQYSELMSMEEIAKELHVKYEKIHPFVDGNGRTGRMFMNWHRMKRLGLPLLILYQGRVSAYYRWFD